MAGQIVEEHGDARAAEALKVGIQQGKQKKTEEAAKAMLADKLPTDKVVQYSGLSLDKVLEL